MDFVAFKGTKLSLSFHSLDSFSENEQFPSTSSILGKQPTVSRAPLGGREEAAGLCVPAPHACLGIHAYLLGGSVRPPRGGSRAGRDSPWGRPEVNAQNTMTRLSSESLVFAGLFSSFLLFSSLRKMKCTASVTRAHCPERAHI